jgi:phosphatidylserine/phosphatidylglycerophosphate/cardiolipin synthase-like enzyme
MKHFIILLIFFVAGCANNHEIVDANPSLDITDTEHMSNVYQSRRWQPTALFEASRIDDAIVAHSPIQPALINVFGPSHEEAVSSIATKIWLIENAEYTIDATHYIFTQDMMGLAMLGALCNAVQRGVDVRFMVDSIGSFSVTHKEIKGLIECAKKAREFGDSGKKARVQAVVFNAVSKPFTRVNRRSHDKLLIVDGRFPNQSWVMTGGRNVSLDYFGLNVDGSKNYDTYQDLEILVRPQSHVVSNDDNVGYLAEEYFTHLFSHDGNKLLNQWLPRPLQKRKAQEALQSLKSMPKFQEQYNKVPSNLHDNPLKSDVKLAHELYNLKSFSVVSRRMEILDKNPNSIVAILEDITLNNKNAKHLKIISPYSFLATYNEPGHANYYDGRQALEEWLAADPERTVEVVSNSVLTSDNFLTQAIIDIESVPRALLSEEQLRAWQRHESKEQLLTDTDWLEATSNPRLRIYQLGKEDSVDLGGDQHYGKLHAKAIIVDDLGFVGTTNLDYRSRLFNNEVGYFYESAEVSGVLIDIFESLKSNSYLWGSKEWLEMREDVIKGSILKGITTNEQRSIYQSLKYSGLKWQM